MHREAIHKALQEVWGYNSFRPGQEEIVSSLLERRDALVVLPTGGGKSLCYQLPAVVSEGMALVVSPLIALMKDQVEALEDKNVRAEAVYSGMHYREIERILDNAVQGAYDLLYLSPERLKQDDVRLRLPNMPVDFIAVDEAHCISQWGHDFRPSYLDIAEIRDIVPDCPFIALTASATPQVREDIVEHLKLDEPEIFVESVFRDNLSYVVLYQENKERELLHILRRVQGSGLVYRRNRKECRKISRFLSQNGVSAAYYHAGRPPEERSSIQEEWLKDETRVVVCTNAFGMGIDKPDVRTVIHMDVPSSLEEYYQESGRAGRDGEMAYCVLLYNKADLRKQEQLLEGTFPEPKEVLRVYKALFNYYELATGSGQWASFPFDLSDFVGQYRMKGRRLLAALDVLEDNGYIMLSEAVFQPTRVFFKIKKEVLYDYQLKHPETDPLIKALLRSYEGMFSGFTTIREEQIAKMLDTSERMVEGALVRLSRDGIIELQPRTDKPTITFVEERLPESNFRIDKEQLKLREKVKWSQWNAMKHYLSGDVCRQVILREYFGESPEEVCGLCDFCRGSGDEQPSKKELRKIQSIVDRYLKHHQPCDVEQITRHFPVNRRNKVLRALEQLHKNGYIRMTDEMTLLPNEKYHSDER